MDKPNPHKIVIIPFDLHEVLENRCCIHKRVGVQKAGVTMAKVTAAS